MADTSGLPRRMDGYRFPRVGIAPRSLLRRGGGNRRRECGRKSRIRSSVTAHVHDRGIDDKVTKLRRDSHEETVMMTTITTTEGDVRYGILAGL